MPSTSAGTLYTTSTATPAGGDQTLWGIANSRTSDLAIPLVVYTHGNAGGYDQFATLDAWAGLREWMIDAGYAWVESAGGGPASWGNAAARASYEAAVAHVRGVLNIGPIVVLGRSMGGLVAYWLYTQSSFAADCVGLIVNSGTTDLSKRTTNADVQTAYGMSGSSDPGWPAVLANYNPMQFPLTEWDAAKVLQLVGTADTTVVPADHGLAIRTLWAGRPTIDRLDVREGGDHSTSNGSYLQVAAMTAFLTDVAGVGAAVPRLTYDVTNAYLMGSDSQLYELTVPAAP